MLSFKQHNVLITINLSKTIKLLKMKKLFFAFAVVLFTTLATSNEIKAQKSSGNLLMDATIESASSNVDEAINENKNDLINSKALKHFQKSFKTAKDVKWRLLGDGYLAKFIYNDIIEKVFYYPNGILVGTLKGYTADKLPCEIRNIIRRAYPDYPIGYAQEVEVAIMPGKITYFVNLQLNHSVKVIRICDEEMDIFLDSERNINRFLTHIK
jgi:hypothetical protein